MTPEALRTLIAAGQTTFVEFKGDKSKPLSEWMERRLTVPDLANIVQQPEGEARARVQSLVERGFVEGRGEARGRTYLLSAATYRQLGQKSAYVRQRGFEALKTKYDAWLRLSGITGQPAVEDVLINIEVAERSGGTLLFRNAGVLFFAKNVRHFFNHAYITCILAKGRDKVHVLDRKDFDGGIVADIEDSMRFIERNTRTAWRIAALQRMNITEFPMKALREAIINAVTHRDWFIEGANVFVEIYTDRIEVSSPGGLPAGMTLADLGHKSIRRNALIADLLHRIDFIEKAGTGIGRIRDEARAEGCPEPAFEVTGFVTATFFPTPKSSLPWRR